eukprot:3113109-Pyramimonas_sp.AAC.1
MDELEAYIKTHGPIMGALQFPKRFRAQVADCYQSNWFVVPGSSTMAFPQEGTGPGQQLGGLVHNFVMALVAKEAQDAL